MHWPFSDIFQKILALSHLWWRRARGHHNFLILCTFLSQAAFLSTKTLAKGVCLANLALGLGIPCAPAVLAHTPVVKTGCCWGLENQVHLFPPKDAIEWIYKKCCRCVCFQPDGNLIKTIKKAPPDFRREVISSSGVAWLHYSKETRSGFIPKLFTEITYSRVNDWWTNSCGAPEVKGLLMTTDKPPLHPEWCSPSIPGSAADRHVMLIHQPFMGQL